MADLWTQKASPATRLALMDALPDDRVTLMVYSRTRLTGDQLAKLRALGAHTQSTAGRVTVLDILARLAPKIADFDFIAQIEASQNLPIEETAKPPARTDAPGPRYADPLLSIVHDELEQVVLDNGLEALGMGEPKVNVLILYEGDISDLEKTSISFGAKTGRVATARCHLSDLQTLSDHPAVRHVEYSQSLDSELDHSVPAVHADIAHTAGGTGKGVIVGIVDSAIDYSHPDFLDDDGHTRILAIWDQKLSPQDGEHSPADFGFGVEYTKDDIDKALHGGPPLRHNQVDNVLGQAIQPSPHGTHVAGIAAGAGRSDTGYLGMAPKADIVFVSNRLISAAQVDSTSTLNGMQYIVQLAQAYKRPVVINISQGTQLGSHDGKSLLEIGLDDLLGAPGVAVVKSAGNSGSEPIHAQAVVAPGATEDVELMINSGAGGGQPVAVSIWYAGEANLDIAVTAPSGETTPFISPNGLFPGSDGASPALQSLLRIASSQQLPSNGNKNIVVYCRVGAGRANLGPYTFHLRAPAENPTKTPVHLWVEGGNSAFQEPHVNQQYTISIPGTARDVITVGSFVTNGRSPAGSLSEFNSQGPTFDGRNEPDITAPGELITAARNRQSAARPQNASRVPADYTTLAGTSMAAPHVTGAIALLFEKNPGLTSAQIRQILAKSAMKDNDTTPNPDPDRWGLGKLDVQAALNSVPPPQV